MKTHNLEQSMSRRRAASRHTLSNDMRSSEYE